MTARRDIPGLRPLVINCEQLATLDLLFKVWAALLGVPYILQLIGAWHSPSLGKEK